MIYYCGSLIAPPGSDDSELLAQVFVRGGQGKNEKDPVFAKAAPLKSNAGIGRRNPLFVGFYSNYDNFPLFRCSVGEFQESQLEAQVLFPPHARSVGVQSL